MKRNKASFLLLFLLVLVPFLSGCGSKVEEAAPTPAAAVVKVQTVAESHEVKQALEYPALVAAETEAKLIAKTAGTLSGADFAVGDQTSVGQSLAKIDEVGMTGANTGGVNSNQIRQAIIGVEQAQASYQLAKTNYENLLVSSVKDVKQAEISRDQAASGQNNLGITSNESVKSAELAYETAKIATEQAKLNLQNREKQLKQGSQDTNDNADTAADAAANTAGNILTGINNLAGFDDNNVVTIPYSSNLGALDASAYNKADAAYEAAKEAYNQYGKQNLSDINTKVNAVISLTEKMKALADATKYLFDKSISSSALPQSSSNGGSSLSGLQSAAAGYQSQLSATLNQVQGAKQGLANTSLGNDTTSDSLQKAYDLAQKQEASAAQSLNNLKAGNTSQKDQAGFAVNLAENQYENLKIKIDSQLSAARTQVDTAQMQYNNASVALQSLYDVHSIVSPIAGTVTQKLADTGDTVSPGQTVAVVSQTESLKVKFFVESDYVLEMKLGTAVSVVDADGKIYPGLISSVSAQADAATKRFQVEVKLEGAEKPLLGTVVTVKVALSKSVGTRTDAVIVPLSALEIGQNGTSLFIVADNKAKKVTVEVISVIGEMAQVKIEAAPETQIIIDGNKFLKDGDNLEIKQ